jgi:hypothetical protein
LPPAISLSEEPFLQICPAAQWVRVAERDRFWQAVADEFADSSFAGCVERAVATAFLTYWQERTQP